MTQLATRPAWREPGRGLGPRAGLCLSVTRALRPRGWYRHSASLPRDPSRHCHLPSALARGPGGLDRAIAAGAPSWERSGAWRQGHDQNDSPSPRRATRTGVTTTWWWTRWVFRTGAAGPGSWSPLWDGDSLGRKRRMQAGSGGQSSRVAATWPQARAPVVWEGTPPPWPLLSVGKAGGNPPR